MVFCAVRAVMAEVPYTENAANVFRSAWIPAPPPESDPAIVSARAVPVESFVMSVRTSSPATTLVAHLASPATGLRLFAVCFVTVLTAALSQVSFPLPFTPVPFTLQPMVVLLGGAALGARLGAASQVLYLMAGVAGLPVFAFAPELPQGALRLLGPSGGYLLAYPLAAFVTGWLAERGLDRRFTSALLAMTAGLGSSSAAACSGSPGSRPADGTGGRAVPVPAGGRHQDCRLGGRAAGGLALPARLAASRRSGDLVARNVSSPASLSPALAASSFTTSG